MGHVYMTDEDEARLKSIAARNDRNVAKQVKVVLDVYDEAIGERRDDELKDDDSDPPPPSEGKQ